MAPFWQKLTGRKPPLEGAPAVRRMKNYSADSGYVYQYSFEGFRRDGSAWEYVFSATANRREWMSVTVALPAEVLSAWERRHAREFSASERFAIAKLALRSAFDECEPPELAAGVRLTERVLALVVETLEME